MTASASSIRRPILIRQEDSSRCAGRRRHAEGRQHRTLGVELAKAAEEFRRELPVGIDLGQIADQPRVVEEAKSRVKTSFIEALAIVLLVSFLSLGGRP